MRLTMPHLHPVTLSGLSSFLQRSVLSPNCILMGLNATSSKSFRLKLARTAVRHMPQETHCAVSKLWMLSCCDPSQSKRVGCLPCAIALQAVAQHTSPGQQQLLHARTADRIISCILRGLHTKRVGCLPCALHCKQLHSIPALASSSSCMHELPTASSLAYYKCMHMQACQSHEAYQ